MTGLGHKKGKVWGACRKTCLFVSLFAFFTFIFPAASFAGEYAGTEQIILTWTGDPATSQTVTWLAPNKGSGKIQYTVAAGFDGDFDAARQMTAVGEPFAGSDKFRYTATLTGLTPETQYAYRVGVDGAWSESKSFYTAAQSEGFTFLYLGDIQDGYARWGSMLGEIYSENPRIKFALLGGDLTSNSSDNNEWGEFLDAATGLFSLIPVMPAKGNHDGDLFLEFFALPDNGPRVPSGEFYSFDYGDAHFVVLDSSNNTSEAVKQWLREDLQGTEKNWRFALFHHPAYPAFEDNKTIDESICENWVPILEQYRVDMVFVGHQHQYMRTCPIFQGAVQSDPETYGIVYVMGNSGSKVYAAGKGFPYIAWQETGSNYQVIELGGDVLTLFSKKDDGELIETFTLRKGETTGPEQKPLYSAILDGSDPAFTPGVTVEGISTLTVNPGISGFNYFTARVTPLVPHTGDETVVFTHYRNNRQLGINATRADFETVRDAQAGFNVEAGDVIKVYIVDQLTNSTERNPVILQ